MESVLAPVRETFRAVAVAVVPEAETLGAAEWAGVERTVERALALRPPKLRRQLRAFLRLIDVLALARRGRPFRALDPKARTQLLDGFQNSRVFLFRKGFWGLRTLILMGYYTRPEAAAAIGYRATPRGWSAAR
jgi:hypothetical protein